MRYSKFLLPTALLVATTATIYAFKLSTPNAVEKLGVTAKAHEAALQSPPPFVSEEYVHRAELWPHLRTALGLLGDRLEKPGKERLVMTGTLRRAGGASNTSANTSVKLVREFPGRLRVEEQEGSRRSLTIYNPRAAEQPTHPQRDADFIETFIFDTAEHFFAAHAKGAATRHLGDRFQLADGGSQVNSAYDVYEVIEDVNVGANTRRQQSKTYYFNSDTRLLELVRYEVERDGETVRVEVRLGNWQHAQEQLMPRYVERRENDQFVLSLEINAITISPRVEDGAFEAPGDN
jgi:hypothetical protein